MCFKEALKIARKINRSDKLLVGLVNLGDSLNALGKTKEAIVLAKEAIGIAEQINEARSWGAALTLLGTAYKLSLIHI